MAAGQCLRADLTRHDEQLIELKMVIAQAARNRRPAGKIIFNKRLHDFTLESLLVIDHVVRNTDRLGDPPSIVNVVQRAAATLHRLRHAGMTNEPPLVPQLHGQADDVMSLGAQHSCHGRGIDSARHSNGNGLRIRHLVTRN